MHRQSPRRGVAAIFFIVVFAALVGFCSLAVDWGRRQVVKTELQRSVDAAARYAVTGMSADVPDVLVEARARARTSAGENPADGTAVALDDSDVTFGAWSPETGFRTLSGSDRYSANAIRVTALRTRSRGNPLQLTFAPMIGMPTCDVQASATAYFQAGGASGIIGLRGVNVKNSLLVASYHSSSTTDPDQRDHRGNGMIASNGNISAGNSEDVFGDVALGPSGTHNLDLSRPPLRLPQDIPAPQVSAGDAASRSNPGGAARDLVVAGTRTLPAGTYYFTSVTLKNGALLRFDGPATVYINGDVVFENNGNIRPTSGIPAQLKITQIGAHQFGTETANNVEIIGDVCAPGSELAAKNSLRLLGRAIFNTIASKNSADFFYDEAFGPARSGATPRICLVE